MFLIQVGSAGIAELAIFHPVLLSSQLLIAVTHPYIG